MEGEGEVRWVSRAEEEEGVFHGLFAGEFATGEISKDVLAVFFVEGFALADAGDIARFKLEPPVWFEFAESCMS